MYLVGDWEVHPRLARIVKGDKEVRLSPKFVRVLTVLAEAEGDVVTRDELLDEVWPGTVVGDAVITRAISELRKAFRDEEGSELIETIPTVGYRLLFPVVLNPEAGVATTTASGSPPEQTKQVVQSGEKKLAGISPAGKNLLIVFVVGGLFALLYLVFLRPDGGSVRTGGFRQVPITSFSGEEFDPVFSPDGERLAFARIDSAGGDSDIFLITLDNSESTQLTNSYASDSRPAFSPDSRFIAFIRCDMATEASGIYTIPISDSIEEQLIFTLILDDCQHPAGLSWSPDGTRIAFSEPDRAKNRTPVYAVEIVGGRRFPVTSPPEGSHDSDIRYSPDGRRIAYARTATLTGMSRRLIVQGVDGGGERVLTDGSVDIEGFDWSQDGSGIILATRGTIQEIDAVTGKHSFIAAPGFDIAQPAVSRVDGRIVFVQSLFDVNIWQMQIGRSGSEGPASEKASAGAAQAVQDAELIISSTRVDGDPRFSTDGQRIAFLSDRSGVCGLYTTDNSGTAVRLITSIDTNCWNVRDPRWSPDGLNLAFDVDGDSRRDIYVVSTAGGPIRKLTDDSSDDYAAGWSSDGTSVYLTSDRSGQYEVWNIDLESGDFMQLTHDGGQIGTESEDGLWVYYTRPGKEGLWRTAASGGPAELVVEDLAEKDQHNWRLTGDDLLYVKSAPYPTIVRKALYNDSVLKLADFGLYKDVYIRVDISPDGSMVVFSRIDQDEDDLMMLVPIQ